MSKCYRIRLIYYTIKSFMFNSFTSGLTLVETVLEPVIYCTDKVVLILGPLFTVLVICLTAAVVYFYYQLLLPRIMNYGIGWCTFHIVFGHWLLINVCHQYYRAVRTKPGYPDEDPANAIAALHYPICKTCIVAKPPRTHHCRICKRCIMKMDHHCPWINNCVGRDNHRYFILFCIYVCCGTLYIILTGSDYFLDHLRFQLERSTKKLSAEYESEHSHALFLGTLCAGVTIVLGSFSIWHVFLISTNQTTIEVSLNRKKRKVCKKKGNLYRNKYDHGFLNNWRSLLGLSRKDSFALILWPRALPQLYDEYGNHPGDNRNTDMNATLSV